MGRERDQVDVNRAPDQLDRHQDHDHVLAVQEDAEHAEGEQDRGDGEVMAEADLEHQMPLPGWTLRTSMEPSRVRASWLAIFWRRTPSRRRRVSTMAPIIAISSTIPDAWNR